MRPQIQISIPEVYKDNESKGLCKVCGKSPKEFEKGRHKYCSEECNRKYQECFLYWSTFSWRWLKEHPTCIKCSSKEELQVDHIEPVAITGIVFDTNNLQTLCKKCHVKKTKSDLLKIKLHKQKQTTLYEKEESKRTVGKREQT